MPIVNRIAAFHDEMTAWRRHLHQHPELGFEEIQDRGSLDIFRFSIDFDDHRGLHKSAYVKRIPNANRLVDGLSRQRRSMKNAV